MLGSVASAHAGEALGPPPPRVRPAGRPRTPPDHEHPWHTTGADIGGVGALEDAATAGRGGAVVHPGWPSSRLDEAHAALREGGDEAVARVRAGVGGSAQAAGGWVPAAAGDGAGLGFRVGSSKWRASAHATAQQAAALEAVSEERRRSERFFARAEERRETEAACEAAHWEAHVHQACRAVERQRERASTEAYVAAGGYGSYASTGVPKHAVKCSGFRPGSAAARRAAGGLLEAPTDVRLHALHYEGAASLAAPANMHSERLHKGEDARLAVQALGAQRRLHEQAMRASDEAVADAAYRERRESQAAIAMRGRVFGEHAERTACVRPPR